MRTRGARDLRPRKKYKTRSDIGKRRKFYAKKPTLKKRKKSGKFVPYVPKSENKNIIKLWFWKQDKMSYDGFLRWNPKFRGKLSKTVYGRAGNRLRIDANVNQINTKERLESFCEQHLYDGVWMIMGFSRGKNKFHVKPVKLAKIRIRDHPEGLKAKMLTNFRLFRYWWWNK